MTFRGKVKADSLVRIAGAVESGTDRLTGNRIRDEIDFSARRIDLPIAVVGKVPGIAFCHGNHRGIFDQNALEEGAVVDCRQSRKEFIHHSGKKSA